MEELKEHKQRSKILKVISHIARLIMGATFIFSGAVKVVDPWGTIIKVNEYLAIYGVEFFEPVTKIFSIWMCGAELMMGMMLTFKVRIRMVSIFALISMSFFTILAFLSATIFPVEDCGCFGDAIKLSPWATFAKNATLLPLAIILWYRYKPDKIFAFNKLELFLATTFFCTTMSIGTYCYLHLPLMDFRPYKIGVNLPEAINKAKTASTPTTVTTLIYRNLKNGETKRFSLDDLEWQDESKWEWVDTITESVEERDFKYMIAEFSIFDHLGDEQTDEILSLKGELVMLCVAKMDMLNHKISARVSSYINNAESRGAHVIVLTPEIIADNVLTIDNHEIKSYNIDASTMKTMIRADVGAVVLKDGVITDKRNWRDL